jgi:hypothetical protein
MRKPAPRRLTALCAAGALAATAALAAAAAPPAAIDSDLLAVSGRATSAPPA